MFVIRQSYKENICGIVYLNGIEREELNYHALRDGRLCQQKLYIHTPASYLGNNSQQRNIKQSSWFLDRNNLSPGGQ